MHADRGTNASNGSAGFTLVELLVTLAIVATLSSMVISGSLYAFDISRLGQTVANTRGVSEAILRYQTDTSTLPAGGLQPVSSIKALLAPVSGNIPVKDGWSNDIYYEPVTVAGLPTFRVYSYGKGGIPDGSITGNWVDFFTDIVVEGGTFIQNKWD